jgi:hypothetical protein
VDRKAPQVNQSRKKVKLFAINHLELCAKTVQHLFAGPCAGFVDVFVDVFALILL